MILATDSVVGFVENSSDPNDLQAWCDACERMFLVEQELSEAFLQFNDMSVVCDFCYARAQGKTLQTGTVTPSRPAARSHSARAIISTSAAFTRFTSSSLYHP